MDAARGWRKVAAFGVLTALLVAPLYALIIQHGMPAPLGLMFLFMWTPATAALITQLAFREPLSALGVRAGPWRWWAAGYLLPLAYAVPVYAMVWATGLGGFSNAPAETLLRMTLATATLHVLVAIPFSLGEELGWRGFLTPQLTHLVGFTRASVIIGVVWAAWHAPVIALTSYNAGTPMPFALACYTLTCVALAFVTGWLRLRSDSVWPAVMLHTTHNAFIAELFTPLTTPTAATPWLLEEWGLGLPLTTGVAALLVWRAWRGGGASAAPTI